jgi:hypothetical protein
MSGPRGTEPRIEGVENDSFSLTILLSQDRGVLGRLSLLVSPLAATTSLPPGARDWIIASSFATLSLRLSLVSTGKF